MGRGLPRPTGTSPAPCGVSRTARGLSLIRIYITYLFWYDKKPVRRAVSRIKHGNNIVAARHIAALLAERMEKYSFDAVFRCV